MKKLLTSIIITYILIFSLRLVTIATVLNPLEQFVVISMLIDYSFKKSKELEDK